jgi:iron(III) transport system permease protein
VAVLAIVGRISSRRVNAIAARTSRFSLSPWRWSLAIMLWTVLASLLCVPIVSLIIKAGFVVLDEGGRRFPLWSAAACLAEVAAVPWRFGAEFKGTILVGAGAATIAVCLGSLLAWRARRGGWKAMPACVVIAMGLAIPGPLVGAALIQCFNHDVPPSIPLGDGTSKSWLLILYDQTPLAPILAQAIRALPLATMLAWHSFATLSDNVLAAAALDGLAPRRVFWQIAVPQRWRAIIAAWIAAFAVATGDLAWAHLVTPPGLDLLQRRVFGLVHSGVEEQVAAISLVVITAYSFLALSALALWRRQSRTALR